MEMKWFNTKRGLQVIPEFYLFVEHFQHATSLSTHFTDNACPALYPNITEKMKEKIQTVQKMY